MESSPDMSRAYSRGATREGVDLRLDANEGPTPAWAELVSALDAEALRRYPDAARLEESLADRFGVTPEQVVVTAGADDAIDRCCRTALAEGGELLLPSPSFEMFERYALLAGGSVRNVAWDGKEFPTAEIVRSAGPNTRAVAVVSPNNPTGAVASREDLRTLAAALPGVLLIVDAAYAEFASDDLSALALNFADTVVLRTFSKAWGLAGLRVGYALGSRKLIDRLRASGPPYAVSGSSIALVLRALESGEPRATVAATSRERAELHETLVELGCDAIESEANFVFARSKRARQFGDDLQSLGIAIRTWPEEHELSDALRITCPASQPDFLRLQQSLRSVMAPDALLLDMDGVIADEGPSYRESIVRTCASWGVSITRSDIVAIKAAGGANNDWDVTHRLLQLAGEDRSPEDVVERFESFYQGDGKNPGLWVREKLLVPRETLARLAQRLPMAIVTGRPRRDALRFLDRFELTDLFGAVVTLDDAEPKPSPHPVHLALERLGVRSGWMVGDTPDDLRAARAANVLPLGLVAPADDAINAEALLRAGAARVLPSLETLEQWLP